MLIKGEWGKRVLLGRTVQTPWPLLFFQRPQAARYSGAVKGDLSVWTRSRHKATKPYILIINVNPCLHRDSSLFRVGGQLTKHLVTIHGPFLRAKHIQTFVKLKKKTPGLSKSHYLRERARVLARNEFLQNLKDVKSHAVPCVLYTFHTRTISTLNIDLWQDMGRRHVVSHLTLTFLRICWSFHL